MSIQVLIRGVWLHFDKKPCFVDMVPIIIEINILRRTPQNTYFMLSARSKHLGLFLLHISFTIIICGTRVIYIAINAF